MNRRLLVCILFFAACARGRVPSTDLVSDVAQARQRALQEPKDQGAQEHAAALEMFAAQGTPSKARNWLNRAIQAKGLSLSGMVLSGFEYDLHGHPSQAFDAYVAALRVSVEASGKDADITSEFVASVLLGMEDRVPEFRTRITRLSSELQTLSAQSLPTTAYYIDELLARNALRRDDIKEADKWLKHKGCGQRWRVAGPVGPGEMLGFDRDFKDWLSQGLPPGDTVKDGQNEVSLRTADSTGCLLQLERPLAHSPGTFLVETTLSVSKPTTKHLRIDSQEALAVWIDGRVQLIADQRRQNLPHTHALMLTLEPGDHRLTIKTSARQYLSQLNVSLVDAVVPPPGPEVSLHPMLRMFLQGTLAAARGDRAAAYAALSALSPKGADSAATAALRAAVVLSDALLSPTTRRDQARRALKHAVMADPASWYVLVQLARLEASEGSEGEGLSTLRQANAKWTEVAPVAIALAEVLSARGWYAEAYRVLRQTQQKSPEVCSPLRSLIVLLRQQDQMREAHDLVGQLLACDARSDARLVTLIRQRHWSDAQKEIERLSRFEPEDDSRVLGVKLDLAKAQRNTTAVGMLLKQRLDHAPANFMPEAALGMSDWFLSEGRAVEAKAQLQSFLNLAPGSTKLWTPARAVFAVDPFAGMRRDGPAIVKAFDASGRHYEAPEVLVLDYTVLRLFEDGSALELTHNVMRLQSREAVESQGEFRVPDGARLLTLRTIKADGTLLEPETIDKKDTISLPNLAPGDAIEFEYVRIRNPYPAFAGGFVGDRFYFQNFQTPFDHTELRIAAPLNLPLVFDPHGQPPEHQKEARAGLQIHSWIGRQVPQLTMEPRATAVREYLPSVNVSIHAGWDQWAVQIADNLADKNVLDPEVQKLAHQIAGPRGNDGDVGQARRLYTWVIGNIEETEDFTTQAQLMIKTKRGSRTRVLAHMLDLVGIPVELAVIRAGLYDNLVPLVPDQETYRSLLLYLPRAKQWLSAADEGAPFGYIPPLLRGQSGWLIRGASPIPAQVTTQSVVADQRHIQATVTLGADGDGIADVVETFEGALAVSWRKELARLPGEELERAFASSYLANLASEANLESLQVVGREDIEKPLVFRYRFRARLAQWRSDIAAWTLNPLFSQQLTAAFTSLDSRKTTLLIPTDTSVDIALELTGPKGSTWTHTLNANKGHIQGLGKSILDWSVSLQGNTLKFKRNVHLPMMRVVPGDYTALVNFTRAVDEVERSDLRMTPPH